MITNYDYKGQVRIEDWHFLGMSEAKSMQNCFEIFNNNGYWTLRVSSYCHESQKADEAAIVLTPILALGLKEFLNNLAITETFIKIPGK